MTLALVTSIVLTGCSASGTGTSTAGTESSAVQEESSAEESSEETSSSTADEQDQDKTQGQPPEKPDDNGQQGSGGPQGTPPDGTSGNAPQGAPNGQPGGGPGSSGSADVTYGSDTEISSDTTISNQSIDSTGTDQEAVLVDNGATAQLENVTIDRTSSDSTGGDNASFYGVGASVLTTEGTTYIKDSTITSDSKGGAGVFSYGDSSTTYVSNTTINTKQDTSGGIHVAGGGKLYACDDTVTTAGESSAAIRSDRGGGTMVVDGGSYTSNGTGSPAIYSTADITVHDADLTANNSETVCIEGLNSVRLFDCDLSFPLSVFCGPGAALPQNIRPHKDDSACQNEKDDQRSDRADHHTAVPLLLPGRFLLPGEAGSPLFDRSFLFHIRLPLPLCSVISMKYHNKVRGEMSRGRIVFAVPAAGSST